MKRQHIEESSQVPKNSKLEPDEITARDDVKISDTPEHDETDHSESDDSDTEDDSTDICDVKEELQDHVFVVHYAQHEDCSKRGSSYSELVGIYRSHEDAVHVALQYFDDLLERVADDEGDNHFDDKLLQRFVDDASSLTPKEEFRVCKKLCRLQKNQEAEESMQATGKYISIEHKRIREKL
jgi:hypothetical protein